MRSNELGYIDKLFREKKDLDVKIYGLEEMLKKNKEILNEDEVKLLNSQIRSMKNYSNTLEKRIKLMLDSTLKGGK